MLLGGWRDCAQRNSLRGVLVELRPAEVVLPRGVGGPDISPQTLLLLRTSSPAAPPLERHLPQPARFWDARKCAEELDAKRYFEGKGAAAAAAAGADARGRFAGWPPCLVQHLTSQGSFPGGFSGSSAAALSALGGLVSHLREAMLDEDLLPLGRLSPLAAGDQAAASASAWAASGHLSVDAAALEALEVLENGEGGKEGTLLAALDSCTSGAGRRRLRGWLCRPLRSADAIRQRQAAVAQLVGVGAEATGAARKALRAAPDLERALARLSALAGGRGRDAAHVVLYEDAGRKRVQTLLSALRGAQGIRKAAAALAAHAHTLTSPLLAALVNEAAEAEAMDVDGEEGGEEEARLPALSAALRPFERAFDWDAADKDGRIVLKPGADAELDGAEAAVRGAETRLDEWLKEQRRALGGGTGVSFCSTQRDSHLVEVPEGLSGRVPGDWTKQSTRKGFVRFSAPPLEALKNEREAAAAAKEKALAGVLRSLTSRLLDKLPVWAAAAEAAATLDALISLAAWSEELRCGGASCTPVFLPKPPAGTPGTLEALQLRHPCAAQLGGAGPGGGGFVPNDISLGGAASPPVLVLTGPNMGGKSTLLRQVCLSALLAHIGADVPASSFKLTPLDALFVRMGARDDLAAGRSTFAVELGEASGVLRRATSESLVAMDELGRGTSTHDGAAIAHAVLLHLAKGMGGGAPPRTLFSTHYHALSGAAPGAACTLAHMGIQLSPASSAGGEEEVTFLYKLRPGACPKSYGVNVARLAGLPQPLLQLAAQQAAKLEALCAHAKEGALSDAEAEALRLCLAACVLGQGEAVAATAAARALGGGA